MDRTHFPPDFVFGVATSAYQIEGATHEDGRGPSIWDTFCQEPGRIRDGSNGDVACDHYHRWEADLDLIRDLGVDAYRFSVAWPRVQPTGRGPVNTPGLDFYDRLVDGMLARGIAPHLTLYHWDLPQTLQDEGGWTNRDVAGRFAEYAVIVAQRLGDRVQSIATLNEPWCSSILSYQIGEHAPGWHDRRAALAAAHHLMLGHGLAMQGMRALNLATPLGIVLNLTPATPATDAPEDVAAARAADGGSNRWFLDPILRGHYPEDTWAQMGENVPDVQGGDLAVIQAPLDFLGVNYYTRTVMGAQGPQRPQDSTYTDMNWEVYPQGLRDLLLRLHEEYQAPPLFITENGAASADTLGADGRVRDQLRQQYLQAHLQAVLDAVQGGADVRGYFAWSLMDNFEWAFGYQKRFGMVYVDYDTQERHLKDSARWFARLLQGEPTSVR